jgi:amidase
MTHGGADLDALGVAEIRAGILGGKFSAAEVTQWHLERIARCDGEINSVIELNNDAPAAAERLDAERKRGTPAGPLHGAPILVKDNIETGDGTMTTAGSLALEGHRAAADAAVVSRLRRAGAVILGKANLAEWANFRSRASTNGWSSRGGLTRNPHDLARSAGGSSSGSAAAVAAAFCTVSLGTETDGSVVSPASINGVVGVKPTVGLISREGIIPITPVQDTAGVFARRVADAAAMLGVIAGASSADPATAEADGRRSGYFAALDRTALRGARIGVARALAPLHPEAEKILDETVRALADAGAICADVKPLAVTAVRDLEYGAMAAEFRDALNAYLGALPPHMPARSLEALIAFNESHRERTMPLFGQDLLERALKAPSLAEEAYRRMRAECVRLCRDEGLERMLEEHRLDALVAMSAAPAWTFDFVNGDGARYTSAYLAAIPGLPNVSVPAGFVHGLPVGLSFMGARWQEARLLSLAYAFEQATQCRRAPKLGNHSIEEALPGALAVEAA